MICAILTCQALPRGPFPRQKLRYYLRLVANIENQPFPLQNASDFIRMFDELDQTSMIAIAEVVTECHYAEGESIFTEGDEAETLAVMVRGHVQQKIPARGVQMATVHLQERRMLRSMIISGRSD